MTERIICGSWLLPLAVALLAALTALAALAAPLSDALSPSWRTTVLLETRPAGTEARTPVELGRAGVEALTAKTVVREVAKRVRRPQASVRDATLIRADPSDWRVLVAEFDGSTRVDAARLAAATIGARQDVPLRVVLDAGSPTTREIARRRVLVAGGALVAIAGVAAIALMVTEGVRRGRRERSVVGWRQLVGPRARGRLALPATVLLTGVMGSLVVARRPSYFTLTIAATVVSVGLIGLFAPARHLRRAALPGFSGALAVLALISLTLWLTDHQSSVTVTLGRTEETRIFPQSFGHPGHFAAALVMLIPFALAGASAAGRSRLSTVVYGAVAAAGILALYLTYARSAWVALTVAGLLTLRTARQRLAFAGGLIIIAIPLAPRLVERLTGSVYVDDPRLDIWGQAIALARDHPVLGVGIGNFALTSDVVDSPWSAGRSGHAHQLVLDTAAEAGIPAACALVAVLMILVARLARHRGEASPAVRACLGAVAAIIALGLLDVALYQRYTLIVAALVFGVGVALTRARPDRDAHPERRSDGSHWLSSPIPVRRRPRVDATRALGGTR